MEGNSKYLVLGEDIKKIQAIELEILLEFDRICRENNIKYQLFAGSLLGAVRHKGFIPWDDDIDVCMLREEYDKFLKIIDKNLSKKYFFQTYKTDREYMNKFSKIRKNNTIFMEKLVENLDMHHGIYIDIFPFDNIEPYTLLGKLQLKSLEYLNDFFKCRLKDRYALEKSNFKRYKTLLFYYIIEILPFSKLNVDNFIMKIMCAFNNKKTEYVADLNTPNKEMYLKSTIKRSCFLESMDLEFEGRKFPGPLEFDGILTKAYGDYMKLPDEEDRVSPHNIIELVLDTKS